LSLARHIRPSECEVHFASVAPDYLAATTDDRKRCCEPIELQGLMRTLRDSTGRLANLEGRGTH
jgi:hypothetical protein